MPRGRPRKTCPDEALKAAMSLFWEKGYEATSMSDLVEATGMAKPGLYATFGDKETLFAKALTEYSDNVGAPLLEEFASSSKPLKAALKDFYGNIIENLFDKSSPQGCFLTNSVVECASHSKALDGLSKAINKERDKIFKNRFKRAKIEGELSDSQDEKAMADFFSGQALALGVMGRSGASKKTMQKFIETALSVLP